MAEQIQARRWKYKIQYIRSKGAILVLIWDILASFNQNLMFQSVYSFLEINPNAIVMKLFLNFFILSYLLFPLVGLIADAWIGRYKVIIVSAYVCFLAWIIACVGYLIWSSSEQHLLWTVMILCVSTLLYMIGLSGFRSVIIPFNIDQLMGSSSEELSAIIYWHLFGKFSGDLFTVLWDCSISPVVTVTTHLIVAGFAITAILVSSYFFVHWLDTTPQITNPLKLIFRVLNYARKNKYPRNHSALTYWEDDYPSRLDLGKGKYGGPFREDEVEDVKAVLRLLPMVMCVLAYTIAWDTLNFTSYLSNEGNAHFSLCFLKHQCVTYNTFCVLILLHQFVIYPCFSRYIPSMLNRVSIGLVIALLTTVSYLMFVLIGYEKDKTEVDCLLPHKVTDETVIRIDYQWVIIPQLASGLCFFFIHVNSFEFVIAQAPTNMRGFVVGIWYAAIGIGELININFYHPFTYIQANPLGCIFYYFLAKSMLILLILVAFLFLTKYYKLRVRENIVPVYQIAEDYYGRYIDQSEENIIN